MADKKYTYIIIGGGLAGASAADGIRELDSSGSILLIGAEKHLPYDRPPLSKKLWFGKKKLEDIFIHDQSYYNTHNVDIVSGIKAVRLDAANKMLFTENGATYGYDRVLLSTGGTPRTLGIPGGDLDEVVYYRKLDDYLKMREGAEKGKSVLIIGGGFIGSEMAAALRTVEMSVSMVFPEQSLVERVFPRYLSSAIQERFTERGISIYPGDVPVSFERRKEGILTVTRNGKELISDVVVAGVGIVPTVELAKTAGLSIDNGIVLDKYLRTSNADIFAAGDNANFHCIALDQRMRVEHWDSAIQQGKQAGRNMAGAGEAFDYIPYFFSDLFEFGYEAAGEVDARLDTFPDWKKENDTGIIYYMKDNRVRGIMLCNVWDRVEEARAIIRKGERLSQEQLLKAIA